MMRDHDETKKPWHQFVQDREVAEVAKHLLTCLAFITCCGFICSAACFIATWAYK